ncbi:hypothetical protein K0M31_012973, partial [Melipona bicolor]
ADSGADVTPQNAQLLLTSRGAPHAGGYYLAALPCLSIDRKSENATRPDEILIVILATARGEWGITRRARVRRDADIGQRSLNNSP